MRVLVTGAAGFIGAAVSNALCARGDEVLGIDSLNDYYQVSLKRDRVAHVEKQAGGRFAFEKLDFADRSALEKALARQAFDRIVHLGAQAGVRYSIENPHAYVEANLVGHVNMLEIARDRNLDHMVYASSSSVYGGQASYPSKVADRSDHPVSLYAATKKADELISETYAHLYRLPLTGLRFFTVYGPWGRPDMAMWLFTSAIFENRPIRIYGEGEMYRDFTFIDDIVSGILASLDSPPADDDRSKPGGSTSPHTIYNIGNNSSEHLMKVVDLIEAACEKTAIREYHPVQPGDMRRTAADIGDIQRDLGFEPKTRIEEGIPAFVEWYRAYHSV